MVFSYTATYESEFSSLCTSLDNIFGLHYTLIMLGVTFKRPSWMLSNNLYVVKSYRCTKWKISE